MYDEKYTLIQNFKCKRCGYDQYDLITNCIGDVNGDVKTSSRYVCRNCDFPVKLSDYGVKENN